MTDLSKLNEQQLNAVLTSVNKNVVLIAGAGAGKTATMVTRTQYLVDDLKVDPSSIMLVTFTNKAANEIFERIQKVCPDANKMWIGTFHKICIKLLRLHGESIGIKHFSILDPKEQKELIRSIMTSRGLEVNNYTVNEIVTRISGFKNNMIRPSEALIQPDVERIYADIYQEYQNICWQRKTFDFDDLIIYATLLLTNCPEVKNWCHNTFKYIMADEVQDTNMSQFVLLNNIIGDNNVMLVGDVNQSIYAFRNAKPQYLENFTNIHPNTVMLKLEKNYRSTRNIINSANAVIKNNSFGTKINMFCDNEDGCKIQMFEAMNVYNEAQWIVSEILSNPDKKLSDYAIIYRANYESAIIERELTSAGLGYTVFGSVSFYSRKEVKDVIAWLKIYANEYDVNSFERALNTLSGVGKTTISNIVKYSQDHMVNLHDVIIQYLNSDSSSRITNVAKNGLLITNEILNKQYSNCSDIVKDIYSKTNIRKDLVTLTTDEAIEKLELLDQFQDMIHNMELKDNTLSFVEIIDQLSLLSDTKTAKEEADCVKLMTAHASKGLEFNTVFIINAHEGSFPHLNAIKEGSRDAIEEERRLFYVAMTRAQKTLYITNSKNIKDRNDDKLMPVARSRFINEIPSNLTEVCF